MGSLFLLKPYFQEKRFFIIVGVICLIIVDLLQLFIPRVIKWVVDDITTLDITAESLLLYALYIVAIALLMGFFRYIWRNCLLGTAQRIEEGLRNKLFSHIQILSASYFDKSKTGDLMAHATNDIQQVRMATGMGLVALNDALFLGLAAVGFMAYINVKLTLFVLIPMPFIVVGTLFFTKRLHKRYKEVQSSFSDLTEVVRERFAGIRLIKAYNLEEREALKVDNISRQYIAKNMSLVKNTGVFFPMMLLFTNMSMAVVLYLGGQQTILTQITAGDFVAFLSYLGLLTWPMMAMGWVINLIQRGRASLDRINTILLNSPQIQDGQKELSIATEPLSIQFNNVFFSYISSIEPVLQDINLHINAEETLGIVGTPGSGKTTLLKLIPRLYDVSQGSISIADKDIRDLRVQQLRSLIAFVPQDPFLFAGTIEDNICLGNRSFSEREIDLAIWRAALYDTIKSFSNGLQTVVGERGVILSGGQKQRIALARGFLFKAPIMILDDPVSQVDIETGEFILEQIHNYSETKITIITSHRISAVRGADNIIVLYRGQIVEYGTHQELIDIGGYYARTNKLQQIEEGFNE